MSFHERCSIDSYNQCRSGTPITSDLKYSENLCTTVMYGYKKKRFSKIIRLREQHYKTKNINTSPSHIFPKFDT